MFGRTMTALLVAFATIGVGCNNDPGSLNEGAAMVKKTRAVVDSLCAAKCGGDKACIKGHNAAIRALAKELGKTRGNKTHEAQVDAEVVRARGCMKRLVAEYDKARDAVPATP